MKCKLNLHYLTEWSAQFVVVWLIVHTEYAVAEIFGRQVDFGDSQFGNVPMYFTIRSALDALVQETQHNTFGHRQLAQVLLSTFDKQCLGEVNVTVKAKSKMPFIAIESSHLTTRMITAKRFTWCIGGLLFKNPPECLSRLKRFFPSDNPLVGAYYTLGMYAVGLKANVVCDVKPVVTTGYWYDKAAFWLKLNTANTLLPPNTSTIYDFPEDLKKPDLMFYINFPDDLHLTPLTTRSPSDWKPRMLRIMRMLRGVTMIELNSRMGFDNLLTAMKNITTDILGKTHDFTFNY